MDATMHNVTINKVNPTPRKTTRRRLRRHQNEERAQRGLPPTDTLPPAYLFASSAFSKMCATITTYPHEVMRTRLREQVSSKTTRIRRRRMEHVGHTRFLLVVSLATSRSFRRLFLFAPLPPVFFVFAIRNQLFIPAIHVCFTKA